MHSCHTPRAQVRGCCTCAGDSKRPKRYFPFAEGPRSCVGQSLAKVSLVATMATLLQHFQFRLASEASRRPTLTRTPTHPKEPCPQRAYQCHRLFQVVKTCSTASAAGLAFVRACYVVALSSCAVRGPPGLPSGWLHEEDGVSHVQMGGPQGVRESEQYTLVIGLKNGMSMHAVPRPGVLQSLCNGAGETLKPAAEHSATKLALA